jgi:cholesterol oxidase
MDGQSGVTLVYPNTARWPLPWIVDELRPLDEHTLLGMTMLNRLGLHRLPAPFLLHRLGPPATMLSERDGSPR